MWVQVPSLGAEGTHLHLQGFWAGQAGTGETLLMDPQSSSPNTAPSRAVTAGTGGSRHPELLQDLAGVQGSCPQGWPWAVNWVRLGLSSPRSTHPKDPGPRGPSTSIISFPSFCHFSALFSFSFCTHRDGLKPKAIYSNYAEGCLQIMQQITLDLEKKISTLSFNKSISKPWKVIYRVCKCDWRGGRVKGVQRVSVKRKKTHCVIDTASCFLTLNNLLKTN